MGSSPAHSNGLKNSPFALRMKVCSTVFLLLINLIGSSLTAQILEHVPSDQRGKGEFRRFSNMAGNALRASIFNNGLSGGPNEWELSIPYEYPKNTDKIYISIVAIWLGGEVTDESGNVIQIVDVPMWRESPRGESWTMEPVHPGFLNPSSADLARSDDESTWPPASEGGWRDKRDDPVDPGWIGSWSGFFGKNIFNADVEMYYRTSDDTYDRYDYIPDETDPTRGGLGLLMDVRVLAWTQILINDVLFLIHDIKNDGTKRIPKASFLIFLADWVGGDGIDDEPYVDILTDVAFLTDSDRIGTEPFGSDLVGVAAVRYIETPGNQVDGIDNDGDADALEHQDLLLMIEDDPEIRIPHFTSSDFESRNLVPGDIIVLIDKKTFNRHITQYPEGGGTVVSLGQEIELPAGGITLEEDTVANLLDEDLDGLIDERLTLHLERFDEISGETRAVRFINYLSFEPGDTIMRGFIVASADAEFSYANVAPMIDESRDDGFDNDKDWRVLQNDTGMDGVPNTGDPGESDGLPTTGAGTEFPGEANIDKTDVSETDLIGLTSAVQIPVGSISFNSPDSYFWDRFMVPGNFDLPRPVGEYDTYVSSGFFPLDPGQRQRMAVSVAIADGGIDKNADIESVIRKQTYASQAYEVDYQFAQAPLQPTLKAVPGDGKVTLYWDDVAESSYDRYIESLGGQANDFEGYRIYRATDSPFEDARVITDAYGSRILKRPIAQFDLKDNITGLHPIDINGVKFDLGKDTGIVHSYVDSSLVNGQRYFYAITAYDFGYEAAEIAPSESPVQIDVDQQGNIKTGRNVAVVRPTGPAAGYLPPEVEWFEHVAGGATGKIGINGILDPSSIKDGHVYEITFRDTVLTGSTGDTLTTRDFTVEDITDNTLKIQNSTLFNTGDEIPVIDGFQLRLVTEKIVTLNKESSGWNHSGVFPFTFNPVTSVGITGEKRPNDYRIMIGESGMHTSYDTSLGFFYLPAVAVNFKVVNPWSGDEVDFAFGDVHAADGLFNIDTTDAKKTDVIFLLEDDGRGGLTYTWQIALLLTPDGRNPLPGDTLDILLRKPFLSGDIYRFKMTGSVLSKDLAREQLDQIRVVPNPYIATESWEPSNPYSSGRGPREIHFVNLPHRCTIRIFNVAGTLVDIIEHRTDLENGTAIWDVLSKENLSIAYGVYLYHVDAPGIGQKKGTFAIIK